MPPHRLAGVRKENLRTFYTHLSNHLRASEERQTQLFLFYITVSAAIIGLSNLSSQNTVPSAVQFGTIALLSLIVWFLIGRHRLWKRAIWDSLEEIETLWGIPREARMESRLGPRMTSVGSEVAMRTIVAILGVVSLTFTLQDWWIPSLHAAWSTP
jgi:hypothetical protein